MKKREAGPNGGGERRAAVVWMNCTMWNHRRFAGLCERATLTPNLTIRHFAVPERDFARCVIQPVRDWKPRGIIALIPEHKHLRLLRKALPRIPLVTANLVDERDAEAMVVNNRREMIATTVDYFRAQGLRSMAFFSANQRSLIAPYIRDFLDLCPGGMVFAEDLAMGDANVSYTHRRVSLIGSWLRSLPKPCGVMTFEECSGLHLVRMCRKVKIRVPQEIQVIGGDEADICLSCDPHVTSISMPNQRAGELCVETLLSLMNKKKPAPPKIVPVSGFGIIPRGSTGPVRSASVAVANAIHLMNANASRGIRAEKIIRLTRSGHTSFYGSFREATGKTPAAYLRKLRLEEACRMLGETSTSITTIAETCGFSSANYFARFFTRETGVSPTTWREQHVARPKQPA